MLEVAIKYILIKQEENSQAKKLFMETKRMILYMIRIQTGSTLVDIFERPVTQWEEEQYVEMKLQESAEDLGPIDASKTIKKNMKSIHKYEVRF